MRIIPRRFLILGGALAVAAGGFAYMASNSVAASYAGEGSNAVSGYTVSNIDYTGGMPFGDNPVDSSGSIGFDSNAMVSNGLTGDGLITTVSFTLSPDTAHWAEVQLYNQAKQVIGGGGNNNCSETAGTWTCNVTGSDNNAVPLSQIAWIDVEAAS